jgi:hypothetical protein
VTQAILIFNQRLRDRRGYQIRVVEWGQVDEMNTVREIVTQIGGRLER